MMLRRRLFAEALGSAMLFAAVIGSGIMGETLAGGNVAVALLGNTLATAAMLFVLITMFAPLSGAHFNPAVSLVFAIRRELSWRDAALYVAAQLVGGLAGVLIAHGMFNVPLWQVGVKVRTGSGQWFGEAVATFALILTILGTVRHRPNWVPAAVAMVITAGYWWTSSTSFANPAITLARALTDSFSGIRPIGAILAALCARWLFDIAPAAPQT